MTDVASLLRGHKMYLADDGTWRYLDTDERTHDAYLIRDCGHCHISTGPDGIDPCLKRIPNVMNACCGHGDDGEAYVQLPDGHCIRGQDAINFMLPYKNDGKLSPV